MFDKELFFLLLSKKNGIKLNHPPKRTPVIKTEKGTYIITNNGVELVNYKLR
jgi:hypothetical protein